MASPIDKDSWQVSNDVWGYSETQTHGGVIDDNVTFDDEGNLVLIANGDWYVGDKQGLVETSNISVVGGQRTGACIASTQAYGPGSFQVLMTVPSFNGICTSMWLYNYQRNDDGSHHNWEIDIEVHGTVASGSNAGNYQTPLFTTWITEQSNTSQYVNIGYNLADGNFHLFRIDWHTGDQPRVEYYIDGNLWCVQTTNVPTNKMFFNIGCWFPNNWCGEPNFQTDFALVKGFSYTPFELESATEYQCEPRQAGGWLENVTVPTKNLLANGSFDVDFSVYDQLENTTAQLTHQEVDEFGWYVTDGTAQIINGDLVVTNGGVAQNVSIDCFGVDYLLTLQGDGNATVNVYYQTLNSQTTTPSVTANNWQNDTLAVTLKDIPPDCTQLRIEIVTDSTTIITNAMLTIVAS